MRRIGTVAGMRGAAAAARGAGQRVGLVPTMGALHEGHLSLVRAARGDSDLLVVSIFVNPTQFAPGEDFDAYPRDLAGDEAKLAALDGGPPDVVFAPDVAEMYPQRPVTTVSVAELTAGLCGASRPGHFEGVTTVVAKLLHIVAPHAAYFGRKDFQQLQVVRRMVDDLHIPSEIIGCPTVREPGGLAMSSRNDYLSAAEREAARSLSRALRAAVEAAQQARAAGAAPDPRALRAAAAATLGAEPLVRTDYVEVVDPDTLEPPDQSGEVAGGDRRLLVACAAHVGPARLIDNVVVGDRDDEARLLAATGSSRRSGPVHRLEPRDHRR